ncbi:hypothetical protein B0H34DRAFT_670881 [Crassisporium funariophilum]|nr:hypothetical protein B0H34DRAFT_670881 [Crassisporium funariophilum]
MITPRIVLEMPAIPSPSVSQISVDNSTFDLPPDFRILSPTALLAVKIYAFGGLAFLICVVLFSLGFWIWTVIIKREFANSPPDIELYPEKMREKEKARQIRLKAKKEEKRKERERKAKEKFSPPPIRLDQKKKDRRASVASTSKTITPSNSPMASSSLSVSKPRRSSLSVSPGTQKKDKRVSWASSAATLDVNGNEGEKPIKKGSTTSLPIDSPFKYDSSTPRRMSVGDVQSPTPIPRARKSVPRKDASIASRAPRGRQMIAATTPSVCESWSKPNEFVGCTCAGYAKSSDKRSHFCAVHH